MFKNKLVTAASLLVLGLAFPSASLAATLSLTPSSGTLNQGCTFSVAVNLDTTGSNTSGTDAIVKYDITKLQATSITVGSIYSDYPAQLIDSQNGKVSISGVSSASQSPFQGSGTFATVNFSVLSTAPTGAASLAFDFTPGSTTDSNVVDSTTVTDVLSSVTSGNYTIGSGSCNGVVASPTALPVGGATSSSSGFTTLPQAGDGIPVSIIATAGVVLTILGILGLAIL